jgi:hypothetical protein
MNVRYPYLKDLSTTITVDMYRERLAGGVTMSEVSWEEEKREASEPQTNNEQ